MRKNQNKILEKTKSYELHYRKWGKSNYDMVSEGLTKNAYDGTIKS